MFNTFDYQHIFLVLWTNASFNFSIVVPANIDSSLINCAPHVKASASQLRISVGLARASTIW